MHATPTRSARILASLAPAVLVVAACGASVTPSASPSTRPSSPATAAPSPQPPTAEPPPSEPGLYEASSFPVPFSVSLIDGWRADPGGTESNIDFRRDDLDLDAGFESLAGTMVVGLDGAPVPWPTDLRAWLATQPEFTASAPTTRSLGGHTATIIDVDVRLRSNDSPRAVATIGSNEWKTVREPERWRFVEIRTAAAAGLVVIMPAKPDTFAAATTALDRLLATLSFTEPQLFSSTKFAVPISLTPLGGWVIQADRTDDIDLQNGDWDGGIFTVATVTLPGPALGDPYVPVPVDFAAWVGQRTEFARVVSASVTVGGRPATQVDADLTWTTGTPDHDLFRFSGGEWFFDHVSAGDRARFVLVPGARGGILIYMEAKAGDFDRIAASFEELLASLAFRA